ncbi:hypothetical protein NDU88_010527 [Pleurodeles waltl]|uniref:Uncharacterized protein n=1 Tax=Pleurodeles waltl TaxID=8319 RepID=A0AAV7Q2G6_PLEWA|nr:hypothetical protein NDU88_010527 [Pleurodeles waltl]
MQNVAGELSQGRGLVCKIGGGELSKRRGGAVKGRGLGGAKGLRGRRVGQFLGEDLEDCRKQIRIGDNKEVGDGASLDHHSLFIAQLKGVSSWGRQGEHTDLEDQGDAMWDAMWDEEMQAVPTIEVDGVIVEREKYEIYGEHSLDREEEGLALALVAALLEWGVDEDEWHCRPPTKVYSRGSGLKESVGKSAKVGVARTRVQSSDMLGEDEPGWGGDLSEVQLNYSGFAWVQYDEEFRARMVVDPEIKWGEIDADLCQHTMGPAKFGKMVFTVSGLPISYRPFRDHPTRGECGGYKRKGQWSQ